MTVKLPANITKTEISVYLCNDTNFRQIPPGLIFAKLNTHYKFQRKQSTFSKDSFLTRRRKLCKVQQRLPQTLLVSEALNA